VTGQENVNAEREELYLRTLVEPIRVCAAYRPKLGHGRKSGVTLEDFRKLYRGDPFYAWFGLDNPLMYAAHKAAGGMTSVYRQIGIGCERLFRQILQDELGLTEDESTWSYVTKGGTRKTHTLSLDARIPVDAIQEKAKRRSFSEWMESAAEAIGVNKRVVSSLRGAVFEVRQGYKSKDSKRQNADIANAATAYSQAYLPTVVLLSTQIDEDIYTRYRAQRWVILVGRLTGDTRDSTYEFVHNVVGFDLAGFFDRNSTVLRTEVARVLETLLRAE